MLAFVGSEDKARQGERSGMMGRHGGNHDRLFYSFNLEEHVPADHLLRAIDRFLDLADLRRHLATFYSHTGRPSIDPELMVRMLLVGYCFGIRSERRLCEEVHLNLAYRWFCRLGLEDQVPDHSSFSKNRHGRFRDSDAFRQLFESVVERCIAEGLVGGEGFAIDASIIRADANRRRGVLATLPIGWPAPEQRSRAVREYLAALDEAAPVGSPPKHVSMTNHCPSAIWPQFLYCVSQAATGMARLSLFRSSRWVYSFRAPPQVLPLESTSLTRARVQHRLLAIGMCPTAQVAFGNSRASKPRYPSADPDCTGSTRRHDRSSCMQRRCPT